RSYLNRAEITLPEGTALSPPAGEGLEGCTDEQLGIGSNAPPTCPAASEIGDVTVDSKNVPAPLQGAFYLGNPTPSQTYRVATAPTQGGASSSMTMTLTNPDRHQLVRTLRASLPPGLAGRLPGVALCTVADAAAGTCVGASKIGNITAAVGSGNAPLSLPGS